MRIHFATIVLDGMPFITHHLPVFHRLPKEIDWTWSIVEGAADNLYDTAWCRKPPARLSLDGTSPYLDSIALDPRIKLYRNRLWPGKTAMFNRALAEMKEPGLLWEIDADEIWNYRQICQIASNLFDDRLGWDSAMFYCRYFVGHHLVVDRVPGTWTNSFDTMWRRVWMYQPGMQFKTHEPPELGLGVPQSVAPIDWRTMPHDKTEAIGCVFDHYAYVTEEQVRFKEQYYGYRGALEGWRRLQRNTQWPAKLREFLPWVKDETTARPIYP